MRFAQIFKIIGYVDEGLKVDWPGYWIEEQLQEWQEKKLYLKNHCPYICN
jgi:hypothetical protein